MLEQIRFKRYLPNNKDEFKSHVDESDHASVDFVFFLYLNDNFGKFSTSFEEYDKVVQPKTGRL